MIGAGYRYRYSSWAWSSLCKKKGSHPTSFSAETSFRLGNRSSTPWARWIGGMPSKVKYAPGRCPGQILDHPGRAIAELLVDAFHLEIARLVDVRIG